MMKAKKEDGREDYFSKVYDLKEELGKGTVHLFYLFIYCFLNFKPIELFNEDEYFVCIECTEIVTDLVIKN